LERKGSEEMFRVIRLVDLAASYSPAS
jgi:hypothetical protein